MTEESLLILCKAYFEFFDLNKTAVLLTGCQLDYNRFRALYDLPEIIIKETGMESEKVFEILNSDISVTDKCILLNRNC